MKLKVCLSWLFYSVILYNKADAFRTSMDYTPFVKYMRIEPYLKILLKKLKPKYKLAIATNRTNTMPTVLREFGLEQYFDYVVCALDVKNPKPDPEQLYKFYSEIAWSHFATVVMFGMLEVAVKGQKGLWLKKKGEKIKKFLEDNLPQDVKDDVVRRYSTEDLFKHPKHQTFGEVIDHLWGNVRGGFVHDVGLESKGLEYGTLIGMGTKDDPIRTKTDVPMPEWLQLTWQAILNSYGYKGKLEHPKLNRTSKGAIPAVL